MQEIQISLPDYIEDRMEDKEAVPGTPEWFQQAFYAIAACATDSGDWLSDEFYRVLGDEFPDGDELIEKAEEMKRKAGLDSLC